MITAVSPSQEENCGLLELAVTGTGLTGLIKGELIGAETVVSYDFIVNSATSAIVYFDLNGVAPGVYGLTLYTPGADSLASAVTVTDLTDNYCTVADVKRFCHIEPTNSNNNSQIKAVIPKASGLIDKMARRSFKAKEYTSTLDDTEKLVMKDKIFTQNFPIISVSNLTIDGTVKTENTDFWIYNNHVSLDEYITSERKGIEITYTAGFETIPEDIRQLAIETASILCNLKTVTYTTAEGIDRAVVLTELPEFVKERIAGYLKVNLL